MTSAQYKQIRESLGSQAKVAILLSVTERTIQRRENGTWRITREAELALHCLQAFHAFDKIFKDR